MSEIKVEEDKSLEPCKQEKAMERLESRVSSLEGKTSYLEQCHAETKIYVKLLLDTMESVKNDIRSLTSKPTSVESSSWQSLVPKLLDLLKWAVIIIGSLVGVGQLIGK